MRDYLQRYLDHTAMLAQVLSVEMLRTIVQILLRAREEDRTVYVLGNGGSAASAAHFVNDLAKGEQAGYRRFRSLALTENVPLLSAWANDASYEQVFAEQLRNFCRPGDVVVALSGSGNSPNVLNAVRLAREIGATTVGLTGFHGGQLIKMVDHCLVVPSDNMQHIEDMHLVALHLVYSAIRDAEVPRLPLAQGGASADQRDGEGPAPSHVVMAYVERDGVH